MPQRVPTLVKCHQETGEFFAEIPILFLFCALEQAHYLIASCAKFLKGVQNEEVTARCLQTTLFKRFFEKLFWGWKVGKERAPRTQFCFPRALHYYVKVLWKRG